MSVAKEAPAKKIMVENTPLEKDLYDMIKSVDIGLVDAKRFQVQPDQFTVTIDGDFLIEIVKNDITAEKVDAVTNAANGQL